MKPIVPEEQNIYSRVSVSPSFYTYQEITPTYFWHSETNDVIKSTVHALHYKNIIHPLSIRPSAHMVPYFLTTQAVIYVSNMLLHFKSEIRF